MSDKMPHPRTEAWFETNRPEIYDYCINYFIPAIINGKRFILTVADVKAGKREIVECCMVILNRMFPNKYKAYYLTSLNRKDVQAQKHELEKYGIDTYVVNSDSIVAEIKKDIDNAVASGKKVIKFLDECDYGTGTNQKMGPLFHYFIENSSVIENLISATAEETLFSSIASRPDFILLKFTPPKEYCGAKYFLANQLIYEPKPFFQKDDYNQLTFTAHAVEVMRESYIGERNIGGVRVTGRGITTDLVLAQQARLEDELNRLHPESSRPFKIKVIDGHRPFEWENEETCIGYVKGNKRYMFVFNQTCTRGTDLKGWHPALAFWHDSRHCSKCNLNTLLQAILRPSHYSSCYKDASGNPTPQKIRMYVSRAAVMAATGDYSLYTEEKGKAPTRTVRTRDSANYEIHGVDESITEYSSLKVYFDAIQQEFPPLSSFTKERNFYCTPVAIGMTAEERQIKVWDFDRVKNQLKAQFNRRQMFVTIPCYMNTGDDSTLRWIIVRKLSKQEEKKKGSFKASAKSMYEITE